MLLYIIVIGDGSASTFWDNNKWPLTPGNENCMEPGIINADYIRSLNPSVKVIIIVRNPAIRWEGQPYLLIVLKYYVN